MEQLRFLTPELAAEARRNFGTPTYVYDLATLRRQARAALAFPNAFGLTARYAMKACSNAAVIRAVVAEGMHIDASSGWEVERALRAGVAPEKISLSTQEMPANFADLHARGIKFNACSLAQLERFGALFPGAELGLRFNPGLGSGGTGKTNVGGPASSFGIWHEFLPDVEALLAKARLKCVRIHTHIGSGSDPVIWQRVSRMSLDIVRRFKDVTTLNLGGGYKVARMSDEKGTDLQTVGAPVREAFEELFRETGRRIHLEIEPGTFTVANAGALVTTIQDIVTTGQAGYTFLKLDAGMTDILRPSLYGAQHPIVVLSSRPGRSQAAVVVGHCCESGDLLTPAPGQPESLMPRELDYATPGDLCVIEGAGAYCAGMSTKNYNSFPEAPEVLLDEQGKLHLIRRRQTLDQMVQNELLPPGL